VIALTGVFLSLLISWQLYEQETAAIEQEFQGDVDFLASTLDRELTLGLEVLYSLHSFYKSSEFVSAAEFKFFASQAIRRGKFIQALEWIPKVPFSERLAFEQAMQDKFANFEFKEKNLQGEIIRAKARDVYFPVYYLEPYQGNETALGFDLASSSTRLATLTKAIATASPAASEGIDLIQQNTNKGILVFLPVFQGEWSKEQRIEEILQGFVLLVFNISDIYFNALRHSRIENINANLLDISKAPVQVLFASPQTSSFTEHKTGYKKLLPEFAGRQWAIQAFANDIYFQERRTLLPQFMLLICLVFIICWMFYLYLLTQKNAQLIQARQKLHWLSHTDPLTLIPNRRYFELEVNKEWQRAIRFTQPVSLIMVDIDYFKLFNDTYGHIAGDQCLKRVAKTLENTINRSIDILCRFGGEEFAIVLENTKNAAIVAEKCRENVEKLKIKHQSSQICDYVTISLGIATIIPKPNNNISQLIEQADSALYHAKQHGRNRVSTYNTELKSAYSQKLKKVSQD
jgi:diguanylate cyclase (GGDEF)-like protein